MNILDLYDKLGAILGDREIKIRFDAPVYVEDPLTGMWVDVEDVQIKYDVDADFEGPQVIIVQVSDTP